MRTPHRALYRIGVRRVAPHQRLDFVIAGLPKCGTWTLARSLELDDRFHLASPGDGKGEMRYFSRRWDKPISWYLRALSNADAVMRFEKSPDYSRMSERRLRWIRGLFPDVRVILIFREPVARMVSHAKMDLAGSRSRPWDAVPEPDRWLFFSRAAPRFDYAAVLDRFQREFGDHLLVLTFDDLVAREEACVRRVYEFLELDLPSDTDRVVRRAGEARNKGPSGGLSEAQEQQLTTLLSSDIAAYRNMLGQFGLGSE